MENRLFLLVLVISPLFLSSQNKQVLYDFTEIPQSLMQNPGTEVINHRWHVGFPLLSGIYINAGASGFSLYDIFADDGVNINVKIRNLVSTTSSNDIISVNQQLEIVNAGFQLGGWQGRDYMSFGVYQELDFFTYWPKDLAILAYEGNRDYIGKRFNLGHLLAKGELLTVFHAGISRKMNEKLRLGARAKIYSGIIDFTSIDNSGRFYTIQGSNNIYSHIIDADMLVNTSGYASLREIGSDNGSEAKQILRKFRKRAFFGGNLGLGFDVGFTYKPSDELTLTGSMLDLGFIHHTKDVESYRLKGQYKFEGLDLVFPEIIDDNGVNDYWDEFEEEVNELYDTINNSYWTWRPLKLNGSIKYAFGKKRRKDCNCDAVDGGYQNAIGAQLFVLNRPKQPQTALTAFYYRRLFNFLRAKATYTVDKFSSKNIGLGISTHFANFNFYILADNLLEYQNLADANNASVQFGFNYIFPHNNKPY